MNARLTTMVMERRGGDLSAGVAVYATGVDKKISRDVFGQPTCDLGHVSIIDLSIERVAAAS